MSGSFFAPNSSTRTPMMISQLVATEVGMGLLPRRRRWSLPGASIRRREPVADRAAPSRLVVVRREPARFGRRRHAPGDRRTRRAPGRRTEDRADPREHRSSRPPQLRRAPRTPGDRRPAPSTSRDHPVRVGRSRTTTRIAYRVPAPPPGRPRPPGSTPPPTARPAPAAARPRGARRAGRNRPSETSVGSASGGGAAGSSSTSTSSTRSRRNSRTPSARRHHASR